MSIVGRLESNAGVRVFNIRNATRRSYESLLALQPDASSWPVPSLVIVAGTVLTQRDFGDVDAVLYLGPTSGNDDLAALAIPVRGRELHRDTSRADGALRACHQRRRMICCRGTVPPSHRSRRPHVLSQRAFV